MAGSKKYAVVNVTAHPHPEGVYERIFRAAADAKNGVRFYSNNFAMISPVSKVKDDVFTGSIGIWIEIDETSNVIKKESMEESLLADSDVRIPPEIGLDSKKFLFSFNVKTHTLYVEMSNAEKKTISPKRVAKAFDEVLSDTLPEEVEELAIQPKPEIDSIDRIFNLAAIKKVKIRIERPNPDDLSKDKKKVLEELNMMNAKSQTIEMSKAAGRPTLVLTSDMKVVSQVAAENGYVKVEGKDVEGTKQSRSTNQYPRIIEKQIIGDSTDITMIRTVARFDG
ncbi:MAG: DUF4747 family protein [Pikeienuella sp.]